MTAASERRLVLMSWILVWLLTAAPAATVFAGPAEDLHQTLLKVRADDEPVVLVRVGEIEAIDALLKRDGISADVIKKENNPVYYVTKFVHRLRRHGKLWMIFDHRDVPLNETLRSSLLADHQVDLDETFGHLSLISVINDFVGAADNAVTLELVTKVNHVVTDIAILPDGAHMLVATKKGDVHWLELAEPESSRIVLTLDRALAGEAEVHQTGESGLIGLAVHPSFPEDPTLYLHYNLDLSEGSRVARIASWTLDGTGGWINEATSETVLLDIPQSASHHNGGALRFGPDGFLYIAVGDGEEGEWVKGRAPASSLRGKVLRIDVDRTEGSRLYVSPPDNPFIENLEFPPETWAWGFRNPWRIAFAPDGLLLAGDVGEDHFEEVTPVVRGGHHGWPSMEGDWCRLEKRCEPDQSIAPFVAYGRDDGMSVTGGEVYEGDAIAALKNHYVFADFSSGRLWALPLPADRSPVVRDQVRELGRWTVEFTSFAKSPDGELYVGDLRGKIYRLAPGSDRESVDTNG